VSGRGDLILELDVGDPRLTQRFVLEEELQRATGNVAKPSRTDWRRRLGTWKHFVGGYHACAVER